jgi:hypothetical protein
VPTARRSCVVTIHPSTAECKHLSRYFRVYFQSATMMLNSQRASRAQLGSLKMAQKQRLTAELSLASGHGSAPEGQKFENLLPDGPGLP